MPKFCVHEHWASHHHWDVRLEMDKVAKSWAVPKEPPREEGVKRLVIQVEDHAIEYMNFEGEIEEGQYGAGKVKIWDQGKYDLIDRKQDKLVIDFKGKKLKGEYVFIKFKRAGEKQWLLFKKKG